MMSPRSGGLTANPFQMLQREMNRLFEDVFHSDFALPTTGGNGDAALLMPRLEVRETDQELRVIAELPGVAEKDIDVALDDDVLTIRGEKKVETKKDDKDKNYHITERSYGMFYRALQLPPGVEPSKVQATMSNGVLKITIPKPARSEPKKIEVKEAA